MDQTTDPRFAQSDTPKPKANFRTTLFGTLAILAMLASPFLGAKYQDALGKAAVVSAGLAGVMARDAAN